MKIFRFLAIASAAAVVIACGTKVEGSKDVKALHPTAAEKDSVSYLLGVNFGYGLGRQFTELDAAEFMKGFKAGLGAKITDPKDSAFFKQFKYDLNDLNRIADAYLAKMDSYKTALMAEKNTLAGEKFVAEYVKANPEAKVSETGLVYLIGEQGSDVVATSDLDTVVVNYTLYDLEGKELQHNENFEFVLKEGDPKGVIAGWREGARLIGEGGNVHIVVPGDLAYGEAGRRGWRGEWDIEPNATLQFDIELLKVKAYVAPEGEE